jgi:hypothetical protein
MKTKLSKNKPSRMDNPNYCMNKPDFCMNSYCFLMKKIV